MAMDRMLSFITNPNKDFLRRNYDKEIIIAWRRRTGRDLQYLGLPGPDMLDIIEWQDTLDRFTTIERQESAQHLLFLRANVRDVEHRLYSLHGEFDKILLNGRDSYNHAPRWPYDLINLDYFGGFLYQNKSRPKALKRLIDNQDSYSRSFLLIITHDLRDGDSFGEKASFFNNLQRILERDHGRSDAFRAFIEWYTSHDTPDAFRQALYMTFFLRDNGEIAHFQVHCRPPIIYTGTGGTKMIHYVTEFHHQQSEHRAVSDQSLLELLNLGLLELREEQLVAPIAMPTLTDFT